MLGSRALAATEKVLYSFDGSRPADTDGSLPYAPLIFDKAGNLYGTTTSGGLYGQGIVFELTPTSSGGWKENIIHSFGLGNDGALPEGPVIMDDAGDLYGTTALGGGGGCSHGCGTVFHLIHEKNGKWKETIIHTFNGKDGALPYCGLAFDAVGNLFGTAPYGGSFNEGTVFELTPTSRTRWNETVLHNFTGNKDGASPYGGVVFDGENNLYGTTANGGNANAGTVFMMNIIRGRWTETILYSFTGGADGAAPESALVRDGAGNFYGTAHGIDGAQFGAVFQLVPSQSGWTENTLHTFTFQNYSTDGAYPVGGVILDNAGNVYGTTYVGGSGGDGVVFELTQSNGVWTETVLHNFPNRGPDGNIPDAALVFDKKGNLYSTTYLGGTGCNVNGCGTVFEVTP
jgi:uncharacterized repeat protein (TIGR03803 family)